MNNRPMAIFAAIWLPYNTWLTLTPTLDRKYLHMRNTSSSPEPAITIAKESTTTHKQFSVLNLVSFKFVKYLAQYNLKVFKIIFISNLNYSIWNIQKKNSTELPSNLVLF